MIARPKPLGPGFWTGASVGISRLKRLQDRPGRVRAPVVDDDDLVGHRPRARTRRRGREGSTGATPPRRGRESTTENRSRLIRAAPTAPASRDGCPRAPRSPPGSTGRGSVGFHPQTRPAFDASSTIQGMSNGRARASEATGWGPKRSSHQSVSCRSDMAEAAPPPTFTIAVGRVDPGRRELRLEERGEVARVQAVAHLVALAPEADVPERPPAQVAVDPVGEDALVRPAELARAREDAAPVDEDGQPEGLAVFQGEGLARELRRAVERDGRRGRERLRDPRGPTPAGRRPPSGRKAPVRDVHRSAGQGRDAVDPARAQEDEAGAVALAVLEQVDRAAEVVLDQLARAREPVDPGQDARIGRGVDHPVARRAGRRRRSPRGRRAWTSLIPRRFSSARFRLAARADEIVEARDLVARAPGPRAPGRSRFPQNRRFRRSGFARPSRL